MHTSPQTMLRLARRILDIERAADQLPASSGAAFDVCEKLRNSLAALAGEAGFRSLLSRALVLATVEVAWLKSITVEPDGSLTGLEITAGLPKDEIARGEATLIAQLISLLITFIGETLTLRFLQDAWPEVTRSDMSSGPETE